MPKTTPPTLTVTNGVAHLAFPTDDYSLDFARLTTTKYGALLAKVTARHGKHVLHMARFDLLNQRDQEHFHQRCLAVNGTVADWQSRLQAGHPRPRTPGGGGRQGIPGAAYWTQGQTAADFAPRRRRTCWRCP